MSEVELPPLPEPDVLAPHTTIGIAHSNKAMQAFARSAVMAERERCAQVVEQCGRLQYADPSELREVAAAIRGLPKE